MSEIKQSPLAWPEGWPRCEDPESSRFGRWDKPVSIARASAEVIRQLELMGVTRDDIIISTNLRYRLDGLPYSNQRDPDDKGVAVYFKRLGENKVLALDKYDRIADNLWAVAKTVEAMRGIERWGGGRFLDRAFTGFVGLPAPSQATWREVLGFDETRQPSPRQIRNQYRLLASVNHPDKEGGSEAAMQLLNWAKKEALKEAGE